MQHRELYGEKVPTLGLGTWRLAGDDCAEAVRDALELGYRHIDTAEAYENEEAVGRGMRESGVDREDVFLVSKVWLDHLNRKALLRAAESSPAQLDTDYLDLLLIHWPNPKVPLVEPLGAMHGEDQVLREIGERYGKSGAQVTLRWHVQREPMAAIPKAASRQHRRANLDIFDFELSSDDMRGIQSLSKRERIIDPSFAPAWES